MDTPEGPPPQTPLLVPPPKLKGYQSAPFSKRHPSAYSSRPETEVLQNNGAKTEIRTPTHTHMTYQASVTGLHSPTLLPFLQIFTISCWHNPVSLGLLLHHWLDSPRGLHPSACASDFWTWLQTPPLTQFAQKGADQLV